VQRCARCGGDVGSRHSRAKFCERCAEVRDREAKRRYAEANAEALRVACRLKMRARYAADPSAARQRVAARRAKDPDRVRALERAWYAENLEHQRKRARQKQRQRRLKDPETIRRKVREYRNSRLEEARRVARERARRKYRENPEPRMEQNRARRARAAQAPGNGVSRSAWRSVLEVFDHRCAYCLSKSRKLTMDHVEPLATGGAHDTENVVPACPRCNQGKKDRRLWEVLRYATSASSSKTG
jgi:5-methylcytosine-specific restriction endonuclease McrA